MTLNASLPAVIQLSGLITFQRRCVLLDTLAAPFCKSYGVAPIHLIDRYFWGREP